MSGCACLLAAEQANGWRQPAARVRHQPADNLRVLLRRLGKESTVPAGDQANGGRATLVKAGAPRETPIVSGR